MLLWMNQLHNGAKIINRSENCKAKQIMYVMYMLDHVCNIYFQVFVHKSYLQKSRQFIRR